MTAIKEMVGKTVSLVGKTVPSEWGNFTIEWVNFTIEWVDGTAESGKVILQSDDTDAHYVAEPTEDIYAVFAALSKEMMEC